MWLRDTKRPGLDSLFHIRTGGRICGHSIRLAEACRRRHPPQPAGRSGPLALRVAGQEYAQEPGDAGPRRSGRTGWTPGRGASGCLRRCDAGSTRLARPPHRREPGGPGLRPLRLYVAFRSCSRWRRREDLRPPRPSAAFGWPPVGGGANAPRDRLSHFACPYVRGGARRTPLATVSRILLVSPWGTSRPDCAAGGTSSLRSAAGSAFASSATPLPILAFKS